MWYQETSSVCVGHDGRPDIPVLATKVAVFPVAMKEDGAFLGERLRRGTVGDDDLAAV
jgi:hypothetical protein